MQPLLTYFVALPIVSPMLEAASAGPSVPVVALQLFSGMTLGIVAVLGALSFAAIIVVSALYFQHRQRQLWHETARLALEKGQPVPPMPMRDEELDSRPPPGVSFAEWHQARRAEGRSHDFKGGLVLIAVGAGLYLMLPPGGQVAGVIPGFIGVALLINTLIEKLSSRPNSVSDRRPPQS